MARNMWARAAAASVVLALVAGCGSSGGAEGEPAVAESSAAVESPSASPSASSGEEAEGLLLTEAQLSKALLEQGDLKGYRIQAKSPPDVSDFPGGAPEDVCVAVTRMAMFALGADSEAAVGGSVSAASGETVGTSTTVLLNSYEGVDAEQVMADLATSVTGCPDGVELSDDFKISAVKSLDAPDTGDEAVAARLTGGILGEDVPSAYTVVRSGTTLALFFSVSLTDPKTVAVPDEVVSAQVAKLEKVAG